MRFRSHSLETIFLILIGGFLYGIVEMLYKGSTHLSMVIVGGICFYLIGRMNDGEKNPSLLGQMVVGGSIITIIEGITGWIVNIKLGLNIWDYSSLPYNYKGQVCLLFFVLWCLLSLVAIVIDDYIKYLILGGKKPKYHLM